MMENNYWKNKNVLITGGTSGLGKNLAIHLYHQDANICLLGRRESLIDEMKKEYPEIHSFSADISQKEQLHPIAFEVHTKLGHVDVLFNVASYLGETPLKLLLDTECEDFEKVLQTNLLAPFRLSKLLLPSMLARGKGIVVNISSDAAINAYATWGTYSVSKTALDHLSSIFDLETRDYGVKFLSIDPGDMYTPMYLAANPSAKKEELRDPYQVARDLLDVVARERFENVRGSL